MINWEYIPKEKLVLRGKDGCIIIKLLKNWIQIYFTTTLLGLLKILKFSQKVIKSFSKILYSFQIFVKMFIKVFIWSFKSSFTFSAIYQISMILNFHSVLYFLLNANLNQNPNLFFFLFFLFYFVYHRKIYCDSEVFTFQFSFHLFTQNCFKIFNSSAHKTIKKPVHCEVNIY